MNPDVEKILASLREQRLGWIADEVEMTIARGKPVTKPAEPGAKGPRRKETMIIPLSSEEEEEVLIKALRSYLVELQDVWESAEKTFASEITDTQDRGVTITISEPSGLRSLELFLDRAPVARRELDSILREAWPKGPDDYERRVIAHRRK